MELLDAAFWRASKIHGLIYYRYFYEMEVATWHINAFVRNNYCVVPQMATQRANGQIKRRNLPTLGKSTPQCDGRGKNRIDSGFSKLCDAFSDRLTSGLLILYALLDTRPISRVRGISTPVGAAGLGKPF